MLIPTAIVQGQSGGDTVLTDTTLVAPAASFDITGIAQSYARLIVWLMLRGDTAATAVSELLRFNNDSGSNYTSNYIQFQGTTNVSGESIAATSLRCGAAPAASSPASGFGVTKIEIPFYTGTVSHKALFARSAWRSTTGSGNMAGEEDSMVWFATPVAINRITIFPGTGNWDTGSRVVLLGQAS